MESNEYFEFWKEDTESKIQHTFEKMEDEAERLLDEICKMKNGYKNCVSNTMSECTNNILQINAEILKMNNGYKNCVSNTISNCTNIIMRMANNIDMATEKLDGMSIILKAIKK